MNSQLFGDQKFACPNESSKATAGFLSPRFHWNIHATGPPERSSGVYMMGLPTRCGKVAVQDKGFWLLIFPGGFLWFFQCVCLMIIRGCHHLHLTPSGVSQKTSEKEYHLTKVPEEDERIKDVTNHDLKTERFSNKV